jgi:hypothetical protein
MYSTEFIDDQPAASQQMRRFLAVRRSWQELTITESELTELIDLTEQAELLNAERIAALSELAIARNQTLPQVMQDLGIHPPISSRDRTPNALRSYLRSQCRDRTNILAASVSLPPTNLQSTSRSVPKCVDINSSVRRG